MVRIELKQILFTRWIQTVIRNAGEQALLWLRTTGSSHNLIP